MKTTTVCMAILTLTAVHAQQPPARVQVVFDRVTVVDVIGGAVTRDVSVVVTDDRITAIERSEKVQAPQGAHVVNAAGKFLIPGLWDMHVHGTQAIYSYYVPNGVTGIRDMGGQRPVARVKDLEKRMTVGEVVAPRIVATGQILEGRYRLTPGGNGVPLATPQEAREAVAAQARAGVDFIKGYTSLPRELYFAIVDEAKKAALPFAGHIGYDVTVAEASNVGQQSIEHLGVVLEGCSSREEELKRARTAKAPSSRNEFYIGFQQSMDTYDPARAAALFSLLAKNGTYVTPTLSTLVHRDEDYRRDPRVKYVGPELRQRWISKEWTAEQKAAERDMLRRLARHFAAMLPAMQAAGVTLLAGTDTGASYAVWPGFSLHEELELLVASGLTAIDALRAATINAARSLGREKDLGSVEAGKLADLVLLDANPLADIRNTTKISAVVLNGRVLDRKNLDSQLAEIEARAKQ